MVHTACRGGAHLCAHVQAGALFDALAVWMYHRAALPERPPTELEEQWDRLAGWLMANGYEEVVREAEARPESRATCDAWLQ